jgi:hypothetical protein
MSDEIIATDHSWHELFPLVDPMLMTPDELIDAYRPKFLDPKELCRRNRDYDYNEDDYRVALFRRVEAGEMKSVIRVADPDGLLIAGPFESEDEIPERVPNRWFSYYYPLEDCEVIYGFERL